MEFDIIKEKILFWDTLISDRMKKYIHYKSMRNFILHFDEIRGDIVKVRIVALLSDYIEEVELNYYSFEPDTSAELAKKYVFQIGEYYRAQSNFIRGIRIQMVFLFGIMGDGLLILAGLLSKVHNIPIVTLGLLLYYLFVAIFKASK